MIIYRRKHKKPVLSNTRKKYSKEMKENPTNAEANFKKRLEEWNQLRFIPQLVVGYYIPDFVFPSKMLIIELDGSVHYGREDYDKERDLFLKGFGFTVLRISNIHSVFYNLDEILQYPDKEGFSESMEILRKMMALDDRYLIKQERDYHKNRFKRKVKRKIKITKEGQPCRKCQTPVIKRIYSSRFKPSKKHEVNRYLYCPGCSTNYSVISENFMFVSRETKTIRI